MIRVFCPTRHRPQNALRLTESFNETTSYARLIFSVDEDAGPMLSAYTADLEWQDRIGVFRHPGEHGTGFVKPLNWVVDRAGWAGEFYGFVGDDHVFRTSSWETKVEAAFHAGADVVYGDDLLVGDRIPTAVFLRRELVRALGWFAPPQFSHLNADCCWKDIGESLGTLRYLPDVVIEHLHPAAGKAENDDQYSYVNSPEMVKKDGATYDRWLAELPEFISQLKQRMGR